MEIVLLIYSIMFIIIVGLLVLAPFLSRRSELFTFNNIFLVGSSIFIGLSGINAVYQGHYFPYSGDTYVRFFVSTSLFYATYVISYYKVVRPYRAGLRFGHSMPVWNPIGVALFFLCLLPLLLAPAVAPQIPGIGRVFTQLGFIVPGFVAAAALWAWLQRKTNLFILLAALAAIAVAILSLLAVGGGRRALYGAIFGIPVTYYWMSMRKWRPFSVILVVASMLFVGIIFDRAYDSVRWIGTSRSSQEIDGADERIRLISGKFNITNVTTVVRMGQTGVEYSLMSIHFYSGQNSLLSVSPLHSLYVLLTFPIPRMIWESKPRHLGLTLPFDARIFEDGTKTNAGPGIAGHLANDGGLLLALPYAILLAMGIRYLDGILHARGDDPLVLGFMAASCFHILGWSRGDISSFTIWPLFCFAFLLVVRRLVVVVGLARRPVHRLDTAMGLKSIRTENLNSYRNIYRRGSPPRR